MNDPEEREQQETSGVSPAFMGTLYGALAKARGEFPEIPRGKRATVKMKSGGSYSYTYADLAIILNAVDPALSANGLGVHQEVCRDGVVTTIYHECGATLRSLPWPIKPMPARGLDDCQSYQSAVQVAKRYSLQTALCISSEDSVEGDDSRNVVADRYAPDRNFENEDGGVGVKGVTVPKNATAREKAEAYANGIIKLFENAKTVAGVNGQWARHDRFIDRFSTDYNDLYQDVFDAFHSRIEALNEENSDD
jgi:hypothetical protein